MRKITDFILNFPQYKRKIFATDGDENQQQHQHYQNI